MCTTAIIAVPLAYLTKFNIHICANIWGKGGLFILKMLTGLKVQYQGEIPKHGIIASQHQSTMEILALIAVAHKPIFVLKRSLMYIPLFGQILKLLGMIPVDRKSFNRTWMENAEKGINQGKTLIIFPEGTRTAFGTEAAYRNGVFRLSEKMKMPITPVAINTGLFWGRRSLHKKSGTARIVFGKTDFYTSDSLRAEYSKLIKSA